MPYRAAPTPAPPRFWTLIVPLVMTHSDEAVVVAEKLTQGATWFVPGLYSSGMVYLHTTSVHESGLRATL